MSNDLVLVTGGSGFVGAYCILQLLQAGYRVRTTVRSLTREADVRAMLKQGGVEAGDALSFVAADLTLDSGWQEAVADCTFVLHVASPFPPTQPKHEDELIIPAREGTLRVLRAARDAGVKRVIVTSSFAAIGYGHPARTEPFTEKDWTDLDGKDVSPYVKSKALAERAAWDFIAREGKGLELTVINPTGIFGPILGPDYSNSIQLVQHVLTGPIAGIPRQSFGIVDVRDVADLHLRAMTHPAAAGERFLAVAGDTMNFPEIARVLLDHLDKTGNHAPAQVLADSLAKIDTNANPSLSALADDQGKKTKISGAKARQILGWNPRSNDEAIIATADSLLQFGFVGNPHQESARS